MKNTYHIIISCFFGQFRPNPRNSFPVQVALWFRLRPWTAPTPAQILGCSTLFLKLEASTKNRKKQNTVQSSNMALESMGGFSILPCLMTGGSHAFEMVWSIESHGLAVMGRGFSGGLYPPKRGIISWVIIHFPTSYSNSVVHLSAQTDNFPGIPRLPPPFCFHCFRLHHAVPLRFWARVPCRARSTGLDHTGHRKPSPSKRTCLTSTSAHAKLNHELGPSAKYMCSYIYIYVCVCIYVYIYIYIYIYIWYIFICIYIYDMYIYIWYIYICTPRHHKPLVGLTRVWIHLRLLGFLRHFFLRWKD